MILHLHFHDNPDEKVCESGFDSQTNPLFNKWIPWPRPLDLANGEKHCDKCFEIYSKQIDCRNARLSRARDMMKVLGIEHETGHGVAIVDLYDILSDDKKLKEMLSKLKLKALW